MSEETYVAFKAIEELSVRNFDEYLKQFDKELITGLMHILENYGHFIEATDKKTREREEEFVKIKNEAINTIVHIRNKRMQSIEKYCNMMLYAIHVVDKAFEIK